MLNKEQHQLIMGKILRDVYTNTSISSLLGFKGGTSAYLFYELPRFSVDLDFDFFSNKDADKKLVFKTVEAILKKYGTIKDSYIKRFTIFFLLSYGGEDHNIKFEVNIRKDDLDIQNYYELREYLGISMLIAQKQYMFSSKLAALSLRKETAMRDIYDIWFFAKNNWDIDEDVIKKRTKKDVVMYLAYCVSIIEQVQDNQILQGLGELLDEKEKVWVKAHLREEAIFMLNNYISVLQD